ncbi:hypothetical protein SPLA10_PHROGS00186 [Salmonella phage SPLA10]|nr:hypothetical protein SPLA10_PHROGS00186 [Salmonella phage SPLA10]
MELHLVIIDGRFDRIDLSRDGVLLFTITRYQSRGLGLVACVNGRLEYLYIYRHKAAVRQEVRFRYGLDVISSQLRKQGKEFKGLFWGSPVATDYLNDRWFGVGNTLLMSRNGRLSDPLENVLVRNRYYDIDTEPLLQHIRTWLQ